MKKFPFPLLALLFALVLPIQAQVTGDAAVDTATDSAPVYFDPATVDLKTLLSDPPANDSDTTKKEIALILQKQAARTPADVARIQREVTLNVYLFDTVFGPWFAKRNLPFTEDLFQRVDDNIRPVIMSAKKDWDRPRPPVLDKRIIPPIELPSNASYPSGHATVGYLFALILAQMAPDHQADLMARGMQIGDDRVLAGVHYPSDVAAGRKLAQALFTDLMASPVFQNDMAQAKAEIAAARAGR